MKELNASPSPPPPDRTAYGDGQLREVVTDVPVAEVDLPPLMLRNRTMTGGRASPIKIEC